MSAPTRRRRASSDVRELILRAAGEAFASKGFSGARLSAIAKAAGVSKSVLFRHFATKEDLFAAAALEPFEEFAAHWENLFDSARIEDLSGDQVIASYVKALFNLVVEHRDPVRAHLIDDRKRSESIEVLMSRLVGIGQRFADDRGLDIPNIDLRVRFSVAMVVSVAALDGWIPPGRRVDRDDITQELSVIAQSGVLGAAGVLPPPVGPIVLAGVEGAGTSPTGG